MSKSIFSKTTSTFRSFSTSKMSAGDLFKYQDSLPSLPVPPLSETLQLYKQSIIPLYPNGEKNEEFKKYSKIIDQFGTSVEGKTLQSKLEMFASDKRNWLSYFWDDYAYLDYRDPVSPFVSYFYSHKQTNSKIGKDQILKSAALTVKILQFMESVKKETLSPELIKGHPFCMESFKWMFSNSRVPGESTDFNLRFDNDSTAGTFVIVVSNGHFYKLKTHDANNAILSFNEIYKGLEKIQKNSIIRGTNKNPIGILSSSNRDVWYKNYKTLKNISAINESNFNDIFKSSFVLCLDDNSPITIESKSRNCWHGNGYNRYFDKPIQIFVSKNGSSGFLGEHSKMDGTPTLRMNDWLVGEIEKFDNSVVETLDSNVNPEVSQLNFEINPEIKSQIQTELATFDKTVNSLDIKPWQYFGFGKDDIKALKCSPDSFVQMLIQLAYYKYTGTLRPTYESASTRKFFKGRTETCRSVSLEALKFVQDWENVEVSKDQKIKSFREAIQSHGNYIKLASSGMGVDRHLFGLKQMIDSSNEVPEIVDEFFNNPTFSYSQHWYLSTSQLSSEKFNGYGWSPVVPEGFGLAYMINKDWLHINITNFKTNPFGLKADEMHYYLTKSLQELKQILSTDGIKPKL